MPIKSTCTASIMPLKTLQFKWKFSSLIAAACHRPERVLTTSFRVQHKQDIDGNLICVLLGRLSSFGVNGHVHSIGGQ